MCLERLGVVGGMGGNGAIWPDKRTGIEKGREDGKILGTGHNHKCVKWLADVNRHRAWSLALLDICTHARTSPEGPSSPLTLGVSNKHRLKHSERKLCQSGQP